MAPLLTEDERRDLEAAAAALTSTTALAELLLERALDRLLDHRG